MYSRRRNNCPQATNTYTIANFADWPTQSQYLFSALLPATTFVCSTTCGIRRCALCTVADLADKRSNLAKKKKPCKVGGEEELYNFFFDSASPPHVHSLSLFDHVMLQSTHTNSVLLAAWLVQFRPPLSRPSPPPLSCQASQQETRRTARPPLKARAERTGWSQEQKQKLQPAANY